MVGIAIFGDFGDEFMDGNMALASPNFSRRLQEKGLWALPGRWASCAGWARPGTCDLLWSRWIWSGWRAHFFFSSKWMVWLPEQSIWKWVIWCPNLKRWMTPKRLHIKIVLMGNMMIHQVLGYTLICWTNPYPHNLAWNIVQPENDFILNDYFRPNLLQRFGFCVRLHGWMFHPFQV